MLSWYRVLQLSEQIYKKRVKQTVIQCIFTIFAPKFSIHIMRIKEIVSALERFAPLPLQDGFDNAGLQIGSNRGFVVS